MLSKINYMYEGQLDACPLTLKIKTYNVPSDLIRSHKSKAIKKQRRNRGVKL